MLYFWTVGLGLNEESFWKSTPRKIFAIFNKNYETHHPEERIVPIDNVI